MSDQSNQRSDQKLPMQGDRVGLGGASGRSHGHGPVRNLFGRPLRRQELEHQVVAKKYALPIFSSDALSSVAYATEEILKVLALAGAAYFGISMSIAGIITMMLLILLISYRQIIFSYPNGGGAYIVARDNLGEGIAQIAGAALLIDYTLTLAVSVASGTANFVSGLEQFFPAIPSFSSLARVLVCLALILGMWYVNKRGVRESGKFFAVPTYFFLAATFIMLAVGFVKDLTGHLAHVQQVSNIVHSSQALTVLLLLRAFASGSTAVTGVEAISNGIPAFKEPKSRNAATTMTVMCGLLAVLFLGVTKLALAAQAQPSTSETVISQLGRTVFSATSPVYVAVIFGTAAVLVMAANTSFNGFPLLAALQARDGFLPQWLTDRDNRLVYGVGISVLALAAGLLIIIFEASVDRLIPLYAIGVFLSFTIAQTGMVVRWHRVSKLPPDASVPRHTREGTLVTVLERDRGWRWKQVINGFGAVVTGVVTIIFAIAKFAEGAWFVVILLPALVFLFFRIHRHYGLVRAQLGTDTIDRRAFLNQRAPRMVLIAVSDLGLQTLPALRDLLQISGGSLARQAIHVGVDERATVALEQDWEQLGLSAVGIPLVVLPSEFGGGNIVGDLVNYVRGILSADPEMTVELIIPEWTTSTTWWRWLATRSLHHLTGSRLKLAFLNQDRVTVTNHRYILPALSHVK